MLTLYGSLYRSYISHREKNIFQTFSVCFTILYQIITLSLAHFGGKSNRIFSQSRGTREAPDFEPTSGHILERCSYSSDCLRRREKKWKLVNKEINVPTVK